jgi:hypothetical protein
MKKVLLTTTALVGAAALFAGDASAETPKVTVGGNISVQSGFLSDDQDANQRSQGFRNDTEIDISVDGKSDSGLGYGAVIRLEADVTDDSDSDGTNASRSYVYLEGDWGRVELGSNVGAATTLKVDASSIAAATGGIDGDYDDYANASATFIGTPDLPIDYGFTGAGSTTLGSEARENANKLNYYTPRFSGFQLGVSYTPDTSNRGQTTGANFTDTNAGDVENAFDIGVNYEGEFDGVGIAAAVTGQFGESESNTQEDVSAWAVGLSASYQGFTLAGSYGDWDDSLQTTGSDIEANYWTLGGAYEFGPFAASVTYLSSEIEATGSDSEFDLISVGADYKLAPGLTPYAEVNFYDQDAAGTANDNEGTVFIIGTNLSF